MTASERPRCSRNSFIFLSLSAVNREAMQGRTERWQYMVFCYDLEAHTIH